MRSYLFVNFSPLLSSPDINEIGKNALIHLWYRNYKKFHVNSTRQRSAFSQKKWKDYKIRRAMSCLLLKWEMPKKCVNSHHIWKDIIKRGKNRNTLCVTSLLVIRSSRKDALFNFRHKRCKKMNIKSEKKKANKYIKR
jgi:hypothetical protein